MAARTEREELDYQYSPSRWSSRLPADAIVDAYCSVLLAATKTARQTLPCELGIEYLTPGGPTLDIYYPPATEGLLPLSDVVFVFFHGGYWEALGVEYGGLAAVPLAKNGATTVAVGYTLAPKANMTTIVEQCRRSAIYVHKRFPNKRIFVTGHSAGAHLAANLMITDWNQYGLETPPFCGSILMAGIYDLTPLRKMYCNDSLHLTSEEVSELSPQLQADRLKRLAAGFSSLVVWGEEDSPAFKNQSKDFSQALKDGGVECTSHEIAGRDHFELLEKLVDEDYELSQMILRFMSQ